MNTQHDDVFGIEPEVDGVRKSRQNSPANLLMRPRKRQRIFGDSANERIDGLPKLVAEACAARFVPPLDLEEFAFGLRPEDNVPGHVQPSNLRRTSDHGTADSGFRRCSAHRRSSSARCSGVSSSARSRSASARLSQSAIASSARSVAGSLSKSDSGFVCTPRSSHAPGLVSNSVWVAQGGAGIELPERDSAV